MKGEFRRESQVAAGAVLALILFLPTLAHCADASAPKLEVNPIMQRRMPPPGWVSQHRDEWVAQHPAYKATCQTAEVREEVHYWNWVVGFDQTVLDRTDPTDHAGDPKFAAEARFNRDLIGKLQSDIATAESMTADLQLLPYCNGAPNAPATATTAGFPPATTSAASTAAPAAVKGQAIRTADAAKLAAVPAPPGPVTAAADAATLPPPPPAPSDQSAAKPTFATLAELAASIAAVESVVAEANVSAPPAANTVTTATDAIPKIAIRFDDRFAALTPAGIHALKDVVDAAHAGKPVQVTIDGCDATADFANGSVCARRRLSLITLLAHDGVRDPKSLLADMP